MSNDILTEVLEIKSLLKQQAIHQKELLDLSEACLYLNVSASFIYKKTSAKEIPHYTPSGKKLYFKRHELDEWLLHNRISTNAETQHQASNYVILNKRRII